MARRMESGIVSALTALVGNVKTAAEAETTHPVGDAPDGAIPATTGDFAKINEADAKENAGPQGVDAAKGTVNPVEKQPDLPAQSDLAPGDATAPAPAEIKPTAVTEHGDTDTDGKALGGSETGDGGEGRIPVGGPKFAAASVAVLTDIGNFLKAASTLIPSTTSATPAKAPAVPESEKIARAEAEELIEAEKVARSQIETALAAQGVAADAPLAVKRAALVLAMKQAGANAADGYIASLDPAVLQALVTGDFAKLAADDGTDVMPPATDTSDAGAAAAADPAAAAPAPEAAGAPAGGDQEQMLQEILQAAQAGDITPDQLMQLLQQMGLPAEAIQQLIAEVSGGAAGGEAAPAPEAGGETNPVETSDVPAAPEAQPAA